MRLIIVANRLPVRQVSTGQDSNWQTSPGGLVSALYPYLKERKGSWIGWPGSSSRVKKSFAIDGIKQIPVNISATELDRFYYGFCNSTLWPLYHDSVRQPLIHRHWWWPYVEVNQRFADQTAKSISAPKEASMVWVQDYQLQLVPGMLRERGLSKKHRIGFFLHIPFPPVELFAHLPWRTQILEGLLGSDVLGFQTKRAVSNFKEAVVRFTDAKLKKSEIEFRGRRILAEHFPITIDVERYRNASRLPEVERQAERIRKRLAKRKRVILGVDRLDYTKGVDYRLKAIQTLLEKKKISVSDFVYVQVLVPSREKVAAYIELRHKIEQMVGHINGDFSEAGQVPVHYLHQSLPFEELIAYYRVADIMLVTPFRDGMNLVSKEYVCSRPDDSGILILSEFAGAAEELKSALLVNPFDADGLSETIVRALNLSEAEEKKRMKKLRKVTSSRSVHEWAANFLEKLST